MTEKIKPFEEIARIFQISNESAKFFLNRVQKSFKVEKPPHKLILEFVEAQKYEFQPTPYDVASAMKEGGVWNYDMTSPPPELVDDEDVYQ
ncbi:MAG: hypothetical protein QY328_14040 [Anaerolineales bacterium]|nr:hypothetical protein [Anaerolineales bacterium]WKZ39381.1 MAG: hypothetical protein QY328_14040 [Anaerolineales bacterium]